MKGAKQYAKLFKTGQYGQLYITSGSHARGSTFEIQVLPKDQKAIPNYQNKCLNADAVLVYGVVSGNRGWTEEYGWLHEGKWQEDFDNLVKEKQDIIDAENNKKEALKTKSALEESERVNNLLANY